MKNKRLNGMKYAAYLPLISTQTGVRFVLNGWFTENGDGTVTLGNGKVCRKWIGFPL